MSEHVVKQLCVNQLPFPEDLLTIIKSFAFDDIVTYMARMRKNTILRLIECTQWSGKYRHKRYSKYFVFWIREDTYFPQFQMTFCDKCGNYITHHYHEYDKIRCKC